MLQFKNSIILLIFIASISFASSLTAPDTIETRHDTTIVWDVDTVFVNDTLYVYGDTVNINIKAGTRVIFDEDGALVFVSTSGCFITAEGTENSKVILTASDPSKGWRGIHFNGYPSKLGTAGVRFNNVIVEYMKAPLEVVQYAGLYLKNTTFRNCGSPTLDSLVYFKPYAWYNTEYCTMDGVIFDSCIASNNLVSVAGTLNVANTDFINCNSQNSIFKFGGYHASIKNIKFKHNSSNSIMFANSVVFAEMDSIVCDSNTGDGLFYDNNSDDWMEITNSSFSNNSKTGLRSDVELKLTDVRASNNGENGMNLSLCKMTDCHADSNGGDGIVFNSASIDNQLDRVSASYNTGNGVNIRITKLDDNRGTTAVIKNSLFTHNGEDGIKALNIGSIYRASRVAEDADKLDISNSNISYNNKLGINTEGLGQDFDTTKIVGNGDIGIRSIAKTYRTGNWGAFYTSFPYNEIRGCTIDSNLVGIVSDSLKVYNSSISNNDSLGVISKGKVYLSECSRVNNDTSGVVIELNSAILSTKVFENKNFTVAFKKRILYINSVEAERINFSIINMQGKKIFSKKIDAIKGVNKLGIGDIGLSKGTYIFRFILKNRSYLSKISVI